MNWFLNTAMRGGELNGVHIRGYVQEKSFFLKFSFYRKKRSQSICGNCGRKQHLVFCTPAEKCIKTVLLIFTALALLSAAVVPFIDPEGIEKVGPVCGGMGVFYLLILLGVKVEARRVKKIYFSNAGSEIITDYQFF